MMKFQRRIELYKLNIVLFSISEEDYREIWKNTEYALIRVEEIDTNTIIKDFI